MDKNKAKIERRVRRHARVTMVVAGNSTRPRLAVFRANQNIYAQLIDDASGKTLASASTLKSKAKGNKTEMAVAVGQEIAKKALELNLKDVVFDRGGFRYHGRVKALADAARTAGLNF